MKKSLLLLLLLGISQAGGWTSAFAFSSQLVADHFASTTAVAEYTGSNIEVTPRMQGNGSFLYKIQLDVQVSGSNDLHCPATGFTCGIGLIPYTDNMYTTLATTSTTSYFQFTGDVPAGSSQVIEFTKDDNNPVQLQPQYYYVFSVNTPSLGSNPTAQLSWMVNGTSNLYIDFGSLFGGGNSQRSRIVKPNSPLVSPTPSVVVPFSFDYYNTGYEGYDEAGVQIKDLTGAFEVVPAEVAITATGLATYSSTYTLTAGHGYLWRPYLRNSGSSTVATLYGSWVGMVDVVTASASSSTPYLSGEMGNSSSTPFFDYLNIPQLLETRLPFAYFFQIRSLLGSLATTTSTFPELVLTVGATSSPIHIQFTVLSSSTILMYSGQNNVNTLRDYIGAALWFALMGMIFFEIKYLHK